MTDALDMLDESAESPPDAVSDGNFDPPEADNTPVPVPEVAAVVDAEIEECLAPNVPEQEVAIPMPARDALEVKRFEGLCNVASELTESKVNSFLGKVLQTRELGRKDQWLTDQKHLVAKKAMQICKDRDFLAQQWGWCKFCMGRDLGKGDAEIYIVMRVAIEAVLQAAYQDSYMDPI